MHLGESMENLISGKHNIQSVPESYVLPPERRPGGLLAAPPCKTIPVIDLQGLDRIGRNELIRQIIKASQEYGFFQLINHCVSEELMDDILVVAKEFFDLPAEDKARFIVTDDKVSREVCRLKSSIDYSHEQFHFWRESFRHPSHPLEKYVHHWPENPTRYREVFGRYAVEVRRLSLWLLELIAEGLGLELGYFGGGLSHGQLMSINHYPACPDPSLVLGLPKHGDPYLITLLNQGRVPGLQVLKDEVWHTVEPLPNSFIVNINHMLQIISNGKLKSADHRVVTNSNVDRTTVVSFIRPSGDSQIEPAKSLINEGNPPLYKAFLFEDFLSNYAACTHQGEDPLEPFLIRS